LKIGEGSEEEEEVNVYHELDSGDLPQDIAFILSTIQKSAPLLGELCGYLNEVMAKTEQYDTDAWKTLQLLSMIILSPTTGMFIVI